MSNLLSFLNAANTIYAEGRTESGKSDEMSKLIFKTRDTACTEQSESCQDYKRCEDCLADWFRKECD